jgi:hypothetical protein
MGLAFKEGWIGIVKALWRGVNKPAVSRRNSRDLEQMTRLLSTSSDGNQLTGKGFRLESGHHQ